MLVSPPDSRLLFRNDFDDSASNAQVVQFSLGQLGEGSRSEFETAPFDGQVLRPGQQLLQVLGFDVRLGLDQSKHLVGQTLDPGDFRELLARAQGLCLFEVLQGFVVPDQVDQQGGTIQVQVQKGPLQPLFLVRQQRNCRS